MRKTELKRLETTIKKLEELQAKPVKSIRELEKRIVMVDAEYGAEDIAPYGAECIEALKIKRWCLMRDSFEWTDENIARLEAANDQMKEALLDMRRKTIEVYESLGGWRTADKDLYVEGTLWVEDMTFEGWEDDEDMRVSLFEIMTCKPCCGFYGNFGVDTAYNLYHHELKSHNPSNYGTENDFLYLSDTPDNWNELMPREHTDHLHLIHGIHNLYEHCHWSLQDLLGICSYKIKIEIEQNNR